MALTTYMITSTCNHPEIRYIDLYLQLSENLKNDTDLEEYQKLRIAHYAKETLETIEACANKYVNPQ